MVGKTLRQRRHALFNLGNTHCPICLVSLTEDGVSPSPVATLEHVPPKAVGGREVCLTCRPCNALASATSDQAVKRSKSPPDLEVDVHGTKRTARFWPEGIPPSSMPYRFGPGPAAKEAERQLCNETIVAVTQPIAFDQATTITEIVVAPKAPDERHLLLSYLRSAYLLVFSLLGRSGYVYARSEALRPIREQILNPGEDTALSLVRGLVSGSSSEIVITLRSNARPFFWSVRFDDGACVFLPHGTSEDDYRRIAELPEHQSIRGWEWRPRKFGSTSFSRHRLPDRSGSDDDGLFGREYVTTSHDGEFAQRWVVVNEVGDAMPAGPRMRRAEPPARSDPTRQSGP